MNRHELICSGGLSGRGDLRKVSSKEINHDNPTICCFACRHCHGCFGADKRRKCIPR
jgi:hypothetical protein